jgi:alkanesulfonate monooxygenase SsuD/methylene tetrahydromethanopterin reductase-like flavin-dependent oxidoreductase (luciferase family)
VTKESWDEYVRVIPKMWTQSAFSWDGLTFSMPERNVLPKPQQEPHPPMWVTVTTPGTELDAADRGLGCLGVAAVSYEEQERRTAEYRRRIESCDPVGEVVTNMVTTQNFLFCHEDIDHAADVGGRMVSAFHLATATSCGPASPTRPRPTSRWPTWPRRGEPLPRASTASTSSSTPSTSSPTPRCSTACGSSPPR